MKICFVIPTLTSGGSERVVSHLANYWAKQGHEVSVVIFDDEKSQFYTLHQKINFSSIYLFDKPASYFKKLVVTIKQVQRLRSKFRQIQPDVIISFIDIAILLSTLALVGLKFPLIVSERNNPYKNPVNLFLKLFNRFISFRLAQGIVLQSKAVRKYFPKSYWYKIRIIPNPVIAAPVLWNGLEERKRIVTVGRLEYQKGHDILIRAFAIVHKTYPEWKLIIVGHGSKLDSLQKLANDLSLKKSIEWYGRTQKVDRILLQSDIFVFSSRFEGFPNALCEAMSCGMPVISTDCEFGPAEIITHHKNGILVPKENPEALAEAICTLIEDPVLRNHLGHNASKISQQNAMDNIAVQWENVLINQKT